MAVTFDYILGKIRKGDTVDLTAIESRITNLENNEFKVAYFASVSSNSGTITIPTGATILLNQFPGGVDAYVSTIDTGQPTGKNPVTAGGVIVDVATFDASGNYTLTGVPNGYPVAIIYILKIDAKDWANLTTDNIIEYEKFDYTAVAPITVNANTRAISTSMSTNKLIGRYNSGTGVMEEVGIDQSLYLDSGNLKIVDKYAVASGTDTYTASISPAMTSYVTGHVYKIKIPNTNTVTNPTLNINSLGAKTIVCNNAAVIPVGRLLANNTYIFIYDGTNMVLESVVLVDPIVGTQAIDDNSTKGASTAYVDRVAKGFSLTVNGGAFSPVDAATYYYGSFYTLSPLTGFGATAKRIIPLNSCTLISATIHIVNSTTDGSNESATFYVRKNDTTDTTLSNAVKYDSTANGNVYTITGLNITFNGTTDYFVIKSVMPTWATNPVNSLTTVILYFKYT